MKYKIGQRWHWIWEGQNFDNQGLIYEIVKINADDRTDGKVVQKLNNCYVYADKLYDWSMLKKFPKQWKLLKGQEIPNA